MPADMALDPAAKITLMESALMRAAETLGDITGPVMRRFYERFPDARDVFHSLSLGDSPKLEGEMVETTLYCLMHWLDRPMEIKILLIDSIPHHLSTLRVETGWYHGLIDAALDTIVETIPDSEAAERTVWQEIRTGLDGLVNHAVAHAERRHH